MEENNNDDNIVENDITEENIEHTSQPKQASPMTRFIIIAVVLIIAAPLVHFGTSKLLNKFVDELPEDVVTKLTNQEQTMEEKTNDER